MRRTRDWRRYKGEMKLLWRMKEMITHRWSGYIDANGNRIQNSTWLDIIGTSTHFMYKTYTTKYYDSRHKEKYGKKGRGKYTWGSNKWGNRESNKVAFKKMLLIDYGIKNFNINYGSIQNNTTE